MKRDIPKKKILPEWVERIKKVMPEVGIENPYQLAKAINAPYATVNSWFNPPAGKLIQRPPGKYIEEICAALKCSREYVYFGDNAGDGHKKTAKQILFERIVVKLSYLKGSDVDYVETIVDAFLAKEQKKRSKAG